MTQQSSISALAETLLTQYDFDLGDDTAEKLIAQWQNNYKIEWLPLAVVEALYLGRYKAICVQQILTLWQRRGQPVYHFNSEFQNIITRNILTKLTSEVDTEPLSEPETPDTPKPVASPPSNPFQPKPINVAQDLVEQIPIQPAQYNVKHSDFYTKLRAFAKNSQTVRSQLPKPDKVKKTQPQEEQESEEE